MKYFTFLKMQNPAIYELNEKSLERSTPFPLLRQEQSDKEQFQLVSVELVLIASENWSSHSETPQIISSEEVESSRRKNLGE